MSEIFSHVVTAIDAANAVDPNVTEDADGPRPAALVYGRRMSAELARFAPGASDLLGIAVRGQHIERWTRPRTSYPEGREGYLAWRRDLGRYHAERVAGVMAEARYSPEDCARTAQIIRKEGIKRDPEVQVLEDVACLVFLRWYFAGFAGARDPEHVLRIVSRTARKMSARGRADALDQFDLPPELARILDDADG